MCMFFFSSLDLLCHHLPHLHQCHLLNKAICKIRKWSLNQIYQNRRKFEVFSWSFRQDILVLFETSMYVNTFSNLVQHFQNSFCHFLSPFYMIALCCNTMKSERQVEAQIKTVLFIKDLNGFYWTGQANQRGQENVQEYFEASTPLSMIMKQPSCVRSISSAAKAFISWLWWVCLRVCNPAWLMIPGNISNRNSFLIKKNKQERNPSNIT